MVVHTAVSVVSLISHPSPSHLSSLTLHTFLSHLEEGGETLIIEGSNFFLTTNVIVTIGTKVCTNAVYQEPTIHGKDGVVTCTSPPGTGRYLPVTVTLDGVQGRPMPLFTYRPPLISKLYQTWAVEGSTVKIEAQNFGNVDEHHFVAHVRCRKNGNDEVGPTSHVRPRYLGKGSKKHIDPNHVDCVLPTGTPTGVGAVEMSNDGGVTWNSGKLVERKVRWFNNSLIPPTDGEPPLSPPAILELGVLFPDHAAIDAGTAVVVQSILLAVNDSVAALNGAGILPAGSTLVLRYISSGQGEWSADLRDRLRDFASRDNMVGIVGPYYSNVAVPAGLKVLGPLKMPTISPNAMSADLASPETYPFFLRACGSNANNAAVIKAFTHKLFWSRVAILSPDDSYAGNLADEVAAALGKDKIVYLGKFKGGPGGGDVAAVEMHARAIVNAKARILITEGSYAAEGTVMVNALALAICGYVPPTGAETRPVPPHCLKGFVFIAIEDYILKQVDGAILIKQSIPSGSFHSADVFSAFAYDAAQVIVRAFAPALRESLVKRTFSSVKNIRQRTMNQVRHHVLDPTLTRSGAITFPPLSEGTNDRVAQSLEYRVVKILHAKSMPVYTQGAGLDVYIDLVPVARVLGEEVDFIAPAWGDTRWPGGQTTVPLDRPTELIPKQVHLAMVYTETGLDGVIACEQAAAEVNAVERVHPQTDLVVHARALRRGEGYVEGLSDYVASLEDNDTVVAMLIVKYSTHGTQFMLGLYMTL